MSRDRRISVDAPLTNTQKVTAPLPDPVVASTLRRLGALLVDGIIISIFVMPWLLYNSWSMLSAQMKNPDVAHPMDLQMSSWAYVWPVLLYVLYHSLFLKWKGATPGKIVAKLHVVGYSRLGRPLTWGQAFIRALSVGVVGWVSGALCYAVAFFREDRRQLADLFADTIVVQYIPRVRESQKRPVFGVFLILLGLVTVAVNCASIWMWRNGPVRMPRTRPLPTAPVSQQSPE